MKMSFTNDVPDPVRPSDKGKWKRVCVELLESNFRAVKVETDSHEEANRVRLAVRQAAKRGGFNVRPTQRGNVVYLVNDKWQCGTAEER